MEIRDVLDAATLFLQRFPSHIPEFRRIFTEEHVHYTIDKLGGVHHLVDTEFAENRACAISRLQNQRYENVRLEFDKSYNAFDVVPPEGKTAIRSIFASVECVFRLMFPDATRLAKDQVEKFLRPRIQTFVESDSVEGRATKKALESFLDWIEASHFYRHEQGTEEPNQPPLSLAVLLVANGANWLRWLAEIDQRQK